MLKIIQNLYPEAIILREPLFDPDYECFFDSHSNVFIAIPKNALGGKEKELLRAFMPALDTSPNLLNFSIQQKNWFNFLFHDGELLQNNEERLRFIHFHIDGKGDQGEYLEAIQSLVQDDMVLVWTQTNAGVIIDYESNDSLLQTDFLSMAEAFLSDFYYPVDFYIGRFYDMSEQLKDHFQREQKYFLISRQFSPQEHIFTFEKSFPVVLMAKQGEDLLALLKEEWMDIFGGDIELLTTVKTFLENNSNTSLTAKRLYMHRNSLQYRIDKFIERTSIDIKNFHGALSVYFICLYGESLLKNGHR